MNKVICSGRLTDNAFANGERKEALKFRIAAKYGYDTKENKERIEFVPCVLFSAPEDKLSSFLVKEGKGVFVEFEGRVASSTFEKDGETKYSTEVIVDNSMHYKSRCVYCLKRGFSYTSKRGCKNPQIRG